jgi:hypothetical protein
MYKKAIALSVAICVAKYSGELMRESELRKSGTKEGHFQKSEQKG